MSDVLTPAPDEGVVVETDVDAAGAFVHFCPQGRETPILYASPHSGRVYPRSFLDLSVLPLIAMRRVEDAYVDRLFSDVVRFGAGLLCGRRSRCYVDLNRHPDDCDSALFMPRPRPRNVPENAKAPLGLGCIPAIAGGGRRIYDRPIPFSEHEARLRSTWRPYHEKLEGLLRALRARFGVAVLIDCHSMPSPGVAGERLPLADIVLGDRFGRSCSAPVIRFWERHLRKAGLSVHRNEPYAGGYCTAHYGDPAKGVHALQLEVRRDLYMDEERVEPARSFMPLARLLQDIAAQFAAEGWQAIEPEPCIR